MDDFTRYHLMLLALAGCGLWAGLALRQGRLAPPPAWTITVQSVRLPPYHYRRLGLVSAAVAALWATLAGLRILFAPSTALILLLWGYALGVALVALAGPAAVRAFAGEAAAAWRAGRGEWLYVLGLTVLALLLHTIGLGRFPMRMTADEENFWRMARGVLRYGDVSPFATGWFQHPYLISVLQSVSISLLGDHAFALRLPSALLGTLHIPALYALARELYGLRAARWSALILALLPAHIMLSRYGLNQPGDMLMTLLALLFLLRGLQAGRPLDYALGGAALALAQFFYAAGVFSLVLILAFGLYLALRAHRALWGQWRGLLVAAAAYAVVITPYYGTLLATHQPLLPRADIYLVYERNLDYYFAMFNHSINEFVKNFGGLVRDAYMAYLGRFDQGRYAFAHLPLPGLVSLPPLLIGFWLAVRQARHPLYLLPLAFVLLIPLPPLVTTFIPDYFRYMLALPFLALLAGIGLGALQDVFGPLRRGTLVAAVGLAAGVELAAHLALWQPPLPELHAYERLAEAISAEVLAAPEGMRFYVLSEVHQSPHWATRYRTAVGVDFDDYSRPLLAIDEMRPDWQCGSYILFAVPDKFPQIDRLLAADPGGTFTVREVDGEATYGRYDCLPLE